MHILERVKASQSLEKSGVRVPTDPFFFFSNFLVVYMSILEMLMVYKTTSRQAEIKRSLKTSEVHSVGIRASSSGPGVSELLRSSAIAVTATQGPEVGMGRLCFPSSTRQYLQLIHLSFNTPITPKTRQVKPPLKSCVTCPSKTKMRQAQLEFIQYGASYVAVVHTLFVE